jgi:hypothetical protein
VPGATFSCRATFDHGAVEAHAFAESLIHKAPALGLVPGRMITQKKPRKFVAATFIADLDDRSVEHVAIWADRLDGGHAHLYVRDGDSPGIDEYTDRASAIVVAGTALSSLLEFLSLCHDHFGLVSANIAGHGNHRYAQKECIRRGVGEAWDEDTARRIEWDAMKWRRARTKLIRLSPITVIGPGLWATLPSMPAFDPMPRITDLGACKVLTAWPTLCEPRDPDFLRATRELRRWLWPFTIQNPADHVDNDPQP